MRILLVPGGCSLLTLPPQPIPTISLGTCCEPFTALVVTPGLYQRSLHCVCKRRRPTCVRAPCRAREDPSHGLAAVDRQGRERVLLPRSPGTVRGETDAPGAWLRDASRGPERDSVPPASPSGTGSFWGSQRPGWSPLSHRAVLWSLRRTGGCFLLLLLQRVDSIQDDDEGVIDVDANCWQVSR